MEAQERERLILENMIVVEVLVGKLLRAGQRWTIEKSELLQVGYLELIKCVDRPQSENLTVDKRVAAHVSDALRRYLKGESKYVKRFVTGWREGIGVGDGSTVD